MLVDTNDVKVLSKPIRFFEMNRFSFAPGDFTACNDRKETASGSGTYQVNTINLERQTSNKWHKPFVIENLETLNHEL